MFQDIVIKTKKSFAIVPAIIATGIVIIFANDLREKLLDWTDFSLNGIGQNIFFLFFFFIATVTWLLYFDNKPAYKITQEGIWSSKSLLSRKLDNIAQWSKIEYYFVQTVADRISYEEIVVKLSNREKYFKIMLTGVDKERETILEIFIEKSKEFNFQNLGFETNRYSKYK